VRQLARANNSSVEVSKSVAAVLPGLDFDAGHRNILHWYGGNDRSGALAGSVLSW
jgi:hypothetical protein